MLRQALPEAFQRSYLESDTYPKNLVHRTVQTYPGALQKIADRLNEAAGRLFERDDGILDVPFRDLQLATGEGEGPLEQRLHMQKADCGDNCRVG
jgi:hypothetical protein